MDDAPTHWATRPAQKSALFKDEIQYEVMSIEPGQGCETLTLSTCVPESPSSHAEISLTTTQHTGSFDLSHSTQNRMIPTLRLPHVVTEKSPIVGGSFVLRVVWECLSPYCVLGHLE